MYRQMHTNLCIRHGVQTSSILYDNNDVCITMAKSLGILRIKFQNLWLIKLWISQLSSFINPTYITSNKNFQKRSCSLWWDLCDTISHVQFEGYLTLVSRVLMVKFQTAIFTIELSFFHNYRLQLSKWEKPLKNVGTHYPNLWECLNLETFS
jgi:hypothetical protein